MSEPERWQLGGSAPELYQRYLVPAVTSVWAADLVQRAALRPGRRVLDVACGTGVVARAAAGAVGPTGSVAGLDINQGMLAVARSLPAPEGGPIEWCEASALEMPYADGSFDAVLCQLGLQFFPDRHAALREMRRVLRDGGRLAASVFGPIEHNPATNALSAALDRHVGPGASLVKRNEHVLGDAERFRDLVAAAGFAGVEVTTALKLVRFPSAQDYVRMQLAATPLAAVVADLDRDRRDPLVAAVTGDVTVALAQYSDEQGIAVPQEVHVALAARGG